MIYYSAYRDLEKVNFMFDRMTNQDKEYLYYNVQNSFVKKVELQYDIIKGKCLMLVNDDKITIGFISISLEHNEQLFVNEVYVMPEHRAESFPILLEAFIHLKKFYLRPIKFVVHVENKRMQRIAKFMKAKETDIRNNNIGYIVQNKEEDK